MWRHTKKAAIYKPGKDLFPKTNPARSWSRTSSIQNSENKSLLLKHCIAALRYKRERKEELGRECVLNEPTSVVFKVIFNKKRKILVNPKQDLEIRVASENSATNYGHSFHSHDLIKLHGEPVYGTEFQLEWTKRGLIYPLYPLWITHSWEVSLFLIEASKFFLYHLLLSSTFCRCGFRDVGDIQIQVRILTLVCDLGQTIP